MCQCVQEVIIRGCKMVQRYKKVLVPIGPCSLSPNHTCTHALVPTHAHTLASTCVSTLTLHTSTLAPTCSCTCTHVLLYSFTWAYLCLLALVPLHLFIVAILLPLALALVPSCVFPLCLPSLVLTFACALILVWVWKSLLLRRQKHSVALHNLALVFVLTHVLMLGFDFIPLHSELSVFSATFVDVSKLGYFHWKRASMLCYANSIFIVLTKNKHNLIN